MIKAHGRLGPFMPLQPCDLPVAPPSSRSSFPLSHLFGSPEPTGSWRHLVFRERVAGSHQAVGSCRLRNLGYPPAGICFAPPNFNLSPYVLGVQVACRQEGDECVRSFLNKAVAPIDAVKRAHPSANWEGQSPILGGKLMPNSFNALHPHS